MCPRYNINWRWKLQLIGSSIHLLMFLNIARLSNNCSSLRIYKKYNTYQFGRYESNRIWDERKTRTKVSRNVYNESHISPQVISIQAQTVRWYTCVYIYTQASINCALFFSCSTSYTSVAVNAFSILSLKSHRKHSMYLYTCWTKLASPPMFDFRTVVILATIWDARNNSDNSWGKYSKQERNHSESLRTHIILIFLRLRVRSIIRYTFAERLPVFAGFPLFTFLEAAICRYRIDLRVREDPPPHVCVLPSIMGKELHKSMLLAGSNPSGWLIERVNACRGGFVLT